MGSVPRENQALLDLRRDLVEGTGLAASEQDLYSQRVLEAYGLVHANRDLAEHLDAWCDLIADVLFSAPPLFVAMHHRHSKVYLYQFQATNPFPGWPPGYGKANHALADLFLLASGEDLVMEKHKAAYVPAVRQVQDEWIKFCYGELQWEPFEPDSLGPVYSFEDFGSGQKYCTYSDAVGGEFADKCLKILHESRLE